MEQGLSGSERERDNGKGLFNGHRVSVCGAEKF